MKLVPVVMFVASLMLASCAAGSDSSGDTGTAPLSTDIESGDSPSAVSANGISRLEDGWHLGISSFSPPSAEAHDDWQRRYAEANEAAGVGRVLIDWTDIEPERGEYTTDALEERLDEVASFRQTAMVTIAAVDLSGTPFPEWLGGFSPEPAAAAYSAMLDHIAPILEQHGVWLLAVANEPPFEEGLDRADFAAFVRSVNDHADAVMPDIPVTFVFAGTDALGADSGTIALRSAVDVLALNHYCLERDLTMTPLDDTETRLGDVFEVAAGSDVVFQELGCPASPIIGSSDELQAEWFDRVFRALDGDESVRAAFVFELHDWSREIIDLNYGGVFDDEPELADFAARFDAWLRTTGLIRDDASTRPAWDLFLEEAGG